VCHVRPTPDTAMTAFERGTIFADHVSSILSR
jgi:hypothetical protein